MKNTRPTGTKKISLKSADSENKTIIIGFLLRLGMVLVLPLIGLAAPAMEKQIVGPQICNNNLTNVLDKSYKDGPCEYLKLISKDKNSLIWRGFLPVQDEKDYWFRVFAKPVPKKFHGNNLNGLTLKYNFSIKEMDKNWEKITLLQKFPNRRTEGLYCNQSNLSCSDNSLIRIPQLKNENYILEVEFDSQFEIAAYIDWIRFRVEFLNPNYRKYVFWLRTIFLIFSILQLFSVLNNIYKYKPKEEKLPIETKLSVLLMFGLILFNDPLSYFNYFSPYMFTIILEAFGSTTFYTLLLVHWFILSRKALKGSAIQEINDRRIFLLGITFIAIFFVLDFQAI